MDVSKPSSTCTSIIAAVRPSLPKTSKQGGREVENLTINPKERNRPGWRRPGVAWRGLVRERSANRQL